MTISCQPDGRPPQPVRPWKSGRVHLADASNVVVLYSTEFGRDSRKFASGVRKYGKFSHFLTHHVVYYGQGKKQILSSLSAADVYRLSHVKVSAFSHSRDIGVLGCFGGWGVLVFGGLWVFCVFGVFGGFGAFCGFGVFGDFGVFWGFRVFGVFGYLGVLCVWRFCGVWKFWGYG